MYKVEDFVITIYCLIEDELYPASPASRHGLPRRAGFPPALSDSECLTIELVGSYLGYTSQKQLYEQMAGPQILALGFRPVFKDRSAFTRQCANLWQVKAWMHQHLVKRLGGDQAPYQIIDTLPVPLCHTARRFQRRIFRTESVGGFPAPTVGYCAAKDEVYFGFKGGLRITDYGLIVHAPLLPAYGHDSTCCDALLAGLQTPTQVIGDSAFIGLDRQQELKQHHIHLQTPLKRNMQPTEARKPFVAPVWAQRLRRLIETVYAQSPTLPCPIHQSPRSVAFAEPMDHQNTLPFHLRMDQHTPQTTTAGFRRTGPTVKVTHHVYFNKFLPEESLTDETEEEEEEEHETADHIDVTDIAFLERDNIGIMARVRQSQRLARIFWRFLTEWLILHDSKGLEINEALCDCEKHHKYYPAKWLVPLVRNKWVPLGKRRAGQATAESLANLLRGSEWKPSSLDKNPAAVELLTAIGVTQFDLLREFVATNDKERNEQNEIFTKILVATSGDLSQISEFVQDLEEDENLLPHLAERREKRRVVNENQRLGQQVEGLVKEILEDRGFIVCRTGTGSDYEISIDKGGQRWLIEVKATRDQAVRMTDIQAKTSVEQGERFLLCVVPVEPEDPDPELDTVRANMQFVKNIGPRVKQLCNDLDGLEELRDVITADESSGVKLEVVSGAARIRVASSVWEGDGFRLEDLTEHLE